MSFRTLADFCSHLQNASKARLGLTSCMNSKRSLLLAMAMHRAGYLSTVYRAGPEPPTEEQMLTTPMEPVTTANVASRRLWIGLKYWNSQPVLGACTPISTPKRRMTIKLPELERVVRGFPTKVDGGLVRGLKLGESVFLFTSEGILEAREALEKRVGGILLCRTS